jgi:hypothetical protein
MDSETTNQSTDIARGRVSIGPAPEWVVMNAVDESWRAPGGAPYSLLLRDEQHHAENNTFFIRQVGRLETLQAVHDAAQWKFDFDPATQRIILHSLTVRRANVAVEHAAMEKLRFLQRESSLEAFSIDGWVSILVLLEDVRVGDIVEMLISVSGHPRTFPDRFWMLAMPPENCASRSWRWSVRFVPSRPMRWKCGTEPFEPAITDLPDGLKQWTWLLEQHRPPAPEPGSPEWLLPTHWLQVSDFASWAEVASGVLESWREEFEHPELRRMVQEIADQAPTAAERITRALSMVQDDIRYLSLNIELGGTIPSPPGAVVQRRFGDCKDKSFLLAHLLRSLGVPARPILVHTRLRDTVSLLLPSPSFNHAVIEYELDGHRHWVDATIPLQGGNAFDRFSPKFGVGLPVGPGVLGLEEQPSTGKQGQFTLHERFSIDEVAHQSLVIVEMRGTGGEADGLRCSVLMNGAERFAESRVDFYRRFFPGARLIESPEWRDDRARNSFQVAFMLALPHTGAVSPDARLNFFAYSAHLIRNCLPMVQAVKRNTSVRLPQGHKYHHIIEFANIQFSGGSETFANIRHGAFEFSVRSGNRGTNHIKHFTVNVLRDSIRPREVAGYCARLEEVWRATELQVLMAPGVKLGVGVRKRGGGGLLGPAPQIKELPPAPSEPLPPQPVAAPPPANQNPSALYTGVALSPEAAAIAATRGTPKTAPVPSISLSLSTPAHHSKISDRNLTESNPKESEITDTLSPRRPGRRSRRRRRRFLLKLFLGVLVIAALTFFALYMALWRN